MSEEQAKTLARLVREMLDIREQFKAEAGDLERRQSSAIQALASAVQARGNLKTE
jgi:hypothetical protein